MRLSAKTQAVLGAVDTLYEEDIPHDYRIMAAALRAAADQLNHATSAHTLYAIADELEAL